MGVEKYRSAEAMNAAPISTNPEHGFERFLRHCARYRILAPRVFPRGVFKYRSIEEAQEARDHVTRENVRRLRRKDAAL
jgi:hypothetical protein